jgi:hypothetical protein
MDLPFFDVPPGLTVPGETNIFTDLINSFRFDNVALREASGFKLKSFTLNATHHMGDWTAKFGMTLSPELVTGSIPHYKFNTLISFLVQWIPIPEIKTDVQYDKQEWRTL